MKDKKLFILLFIIMLFSIGFTMLTIIFCLDNNLKHKNDIWDIHFENLNVLEGSVSGENIVKMPTISNNNLIEYSVILEKPGDYYEFEVVVINDGTLDAELSVIPTIKGISEKQDKYINYIVTYSNGTQINATDKLLSNRTVTYKVRVFYESSSLSYEEQRLNLVFSVNYSQI